MPSFKENSPEPAGAKAGSGVAERSAWRRASDEHDLNARIGQRIRQHREGLGMSLNVASKATGLPAATLSRIENNRMSPTMPVVLKVLAGLRMAWADLMAPVAPQSNEAQISVALAGQGEMVEVQGNTYAVLHTGSALRHHFQPVVFEIRSRSVEEAGGLRGHTGAELCYVLSGTLLLHFVDRAPLELAVGASALFNSEIPHAYVTKGRGSARVLLLGAIDPLIGAPEDFRPLLAQLRQRVLAQDDAKSVEAA